jgi:nicotinate-nucleotide--dimethylbenzimidazole phosphoribosyltransferase
MSVDEAVAAVLVGAEVAGDLVAGGADVLVGGEMGIGNTTPSAALVAALTGGDPVALTGRGTGIDDTTLERKAAVVAAAVARARATMGDPPDALAVLADIGGLEVAALVGFLLAGAAARVPVVLDGVISLAAACVAVHLQPACRDHLVAGHRSSEPAASAALDWLGLEPLIDLGLRLGEGSGAVLAVPLVQAAAAVMAEMATFGEAGVSDGPS